MASELESDLQGTVDWNRKWLVNFNAGKTQLVLFNQSNNTGAIDVKTDGSLLEEKWSLMILGLTFSSKLDWGSYIISIAKTASKKNEALICSVKFLSPGLLYISINQTFTNCVHSYKKGVKVLIENTTENYLLPTHTHHYVLSK